MDKPKVYINKAWYTNKDQRQMVDAIKAFKEGKEQPEGRLKILGFLPKEDEQ